MTANPVRRTECVRIEALDGTVVRVAATFPSDLYMSNGSLYTGGGFTSASTREVAAETGSGMIDFGFVDELSGIDRDQIASGKWDSSSIYLFATDWADPVEDEEPIALLTMGKITDVDGRFQGQLMGLTDKLNQSTGRTCTPLCGWVYADHHLDTGDIIYTTANHGCGIDKTSKIVTGTITHVTDNQQFRDSSRAEDEDWFGNGEIIFTTGSNAGLSRRTVKSYSADGSIVANAPFYYAPEVGDEYQMIAGCRKRPNEDCKTKHNNRPRFGGFSYVPQQSQVVRVGRG